MSVRDVHWEVTNACNLRCGHCVQCAGKPRPSELSPDQAIAVVDRLTAAGVHRICLTGGEPFVRPDCLPLIRHIVERGMTCAVITNGMLVTTQDLRQLADWSVSLGVSLDGPTAATHDSLRGSGSFAAAVSVLDQARAWGMNATVYTTVHRQTYDLLDRIVEFVHSFGYGLHINEISLAGRASQRWPEYALSRTQRQDLSDRVRLLAERWYGETPTYCPDGCWVDGSSVYLRSDGQLFLCSEQVQHPQSHALGSVLDKPLGTLVTADSFARCQGADCCYRVMASDHVSLIRNQPVACPLVPPGKTIQTLDELNHELDALYAPFAQTCVDCRDKCCQGYVWLMPDEADQLVERDVPTVQINDTSSFIHSFPEGDDGSIDVTAEAPLCSQLCCLQPRRCRIYADRPFSCRLYPVGFEMREDGVLVWALHLDCQISRQLEARGITDEFSRRFETILDSIAPELYAQIITTYRQVHAISTFPHGGNTYRTLKEVR